MQRKIIFLLWVIALVISIFVLAGYKVGKDFAEKENSQVIERNSKP